MHELGIVIHVMKTIEDIAPENHITKVGSVTLEVGEVSGIVTNEFVDAWNYFRKKKPLFEDAELNIIKMQAITYCTACKKTYPTVEYGRTCPYCKSGETYLVTGNECTIRDVTAQTEAEKEDDPGMPSGAEQESRT